MSVELKAWLSRAVVAALEAGRAILDVYRSDDFDIQLKSDHSPLTRADRLAHTIIVKSLNGCASGCGSGSEVTKPTLSLVHPPSTIHHPRMGDLALPILSEEGSNIPYDERAGWSRFWLVDPLDGTKEFIKRNGEFTVNIALIEKCRPKLGVVYAPVLDRLYFGVENLGAYRLDKASKHLTELGPDFSTSSLISRSDCLPLSKYQVEQERDPGNSNTESLPTERRTLNTENRGPHSPSTDHGEAPLRLVASRSHLNEETKAVIQKLEKQHGHVELVQAGSSLKLCLVAEGSADLYPRLGPTMEWDTAAAHAIVVAAGGRVIRLPQQTDLVYNKPDLLNPQFMVLAAGSPMPQ